MDRTLRSFLQQADDLHESLEKYCVALTAEQIEEKVLELQSAMKTIQSVVYQMANVSNIATRVANRKRKTKAKNETSDRPVIDPYPTEHDIGTLRSVNPQESKEIMTGITIPIRTVATAKEIPVSNLYYVEEMKQYAINIEGIILRGDLCNITDYQTELSAVCEYGISCKSFQKHTKCPYYHDPSDYIYHKQEIPTSRRNFTIGSWIYSKKKTPKTYFTRHLGSRDRLMYDLATLKRVQYREEIYNREGQLIHDLLIYMILNSKGLLERYPHWQKIPKNT